MSNYFHDQAALDVATQIMALVNGPKLLGGDAQLKAKIQCLIIDVLEQYGRKPAAGEPVAKPDSSDTFYAGLYHKSSTMWRQLHDLAVSKGYDHARYAIECAPVYKCDCRGARKVGIDLEGRTRPCECVEAANESAPTSAEPVAWQMRSTLATSWMNCEKKLHDGIRKDPELQGVYEVRELFATPPAAAHGDEAVRFERADVVAVLREDLLAMSVDVDPSTGRSEMECLLASWLKGHDIPVFRKTLYAMRAQGDGE